ncbi:MAG: nucleotidyltransferase [Candidatus Gracilibacteria bacterium]|nr:nucleotidyltransferase [Candidatus Gracilibacteria bacterium]
MSVLSYLQNKASSAVLSVSEKSSIDTSISTLKTRLGYHFSNSEIKEHFRFGSSTRDTILPRFMDDQSDIDYMIVFSDNQYTPQTYLNQLKKFATDRYGSSEIFQSSPTIVLELNHIKFDLVPAIRTWSGGLQIPSRTSAWQDTNPNDFNNNLIIANTSNSFLIKPTIRLMKYWNVKSGGGFDSFLLEKWIINQNFFNCSNQKDYLFSIIDKLTTSTNYSQKLNDEISRAKKIITTVREDEAKYPNLAESEIKKLFRDS